MKSCTSCKESKPNDSFPIKKERNGKTRLSSWCKACTSKRASESNKRIREKDVEASKLRSRESYHKHRAKRLLSNKIRGRSLKQKYVEYKGGKCCICGYNKFLAAMDFHHVNPNEKEFMITQRKNWDDIKQELNKCVLLCSNCHRAIHSGELSLDAV